MKGLAWSGIHNKVDCILPSPEMGRLPALGQKVRYSAAGNAWALPSPFRTVDGEHVKSCYHLQQRWIRLRFDSSAIMPPVGASFGQSRHLSQWRSSVTNSTPAIRPTHQVHQSTIEEGSQCNEVYSSSSNFSSDKPSGICDGGANASSLLILFRNTPTGIPNPIYRTSHLSVDTLIPERSTPTRTVHHMEAHIHRTSRQSPYRRGNDRG